MEKVRPMEVKQLTRVTELVRCSAKVKARLSGSCVHAFTMINLYSVCHSDKNHSHMSIHM